MLQEKIDIKVININGQITIGKEYAGQQVQIFKQDDSTWIIKKGQFIPDNERWLYERDNFERINKALLWAENNPRTNNFEEIKNKIIND